MKNIHWRRKITKACLERKSAWRVRFLLCFGCCCKCESVAFFWPSTNNRQTDFRLYLSSIWAMTHNTNNFACCSSLTTIRTKSDGEPNRTEKERERDSEKNKSIAETKGSNLCVPKWWMVFVLLLWMCLIILMSAYNKRKHPTYISNSEHLWIWLYFAIDENSYRFYVASSTPQCFAGVGDETKTILNTMQWHWLIEWGTPIHI